MQLIDEAFLDNLSGEAKRSPRRRMNFNFHESAESKSQRLLNAMEPDTVFPIHRHRNTAETYILLRGRIRVSFYNDAQVVTDSEILDCTEGKFGLNIPAGQWHFIEVLEEGSIIFEAKDGTYAPLIEKDILKLTQNT